MLIQSFGHCTVALTSNQSAVIPDTPYEIAIMAHGIEHANAWLYALTTHVSFVSTETGRVFQATQRKLFEP